MTQSLLIYTERQQRLCAHTATHIHHTHIHCKDTTQLLHIYMIAWCSKSINFSIFWLIYMRCKYINQSSFSSFSWMIIQQTWKLTSKWSAFIYIDQSSFNHTDKLKAYVEVISFFNFELFKWLLDHINSSRACLHKLSMWLINEKIYSSDYD